MNIIPENAKPYIAGTITGVAFIIGIQLFGRIALAIWGG